VAARVLSRLRLRTLAALTEVMLPRSEEFSLGVEAEVTAGVARLMAYLPAALRAALGAFLLIVEFCPLLTIGKPARFSRLAYPDRHRVVHRLIRSRLSLVRATARVVNALVAVHFYDDPRVWKHLNYSIEEHIRQVNAPTPVRARDTKPWPESAGPHRS
jgi:hypothetical protein